MLCCSPPLVLLPYNTVHVNMCCACLVCAFEGVLSIQAAVLDTPGSLPCTFPANGTAGLSLADVWKFKRQAPE
jgi:hypothetical protein